MEWAIVFFSIFIVCLMQMNSINDTHEDFENENDLFSWIKSIWIDVNHNEISLDDKHFGFIPYFRSYDRQKENTNWIIEISYVI